MFKPSVRHAVSSFAASFAASVAAFAAASLPLPGLTQADAQTLLPIGDSITFGTRSVETGGYRGPLSTLGPSLDFAGPFNDAAGDHYGIPGITGSGLVSDLNATAFLDGLSLDGILLHIGTNRLNETQGNVFNAINTDLRPLLSLVRAETNATIYVARIIPDGGNKLFEPGGLVGAQQNVLRTAQYNYRSLAGHPFPTHNLDAVAGEFTGIELVDFFRIDASTLTSLSPAELALIDTDADPFVDWVVGYDEDDPTDVSGITDFSPDLFHTDKLHPSSLGYKVMAEVWARALGVWPGDPSVAGDANGDGLVDLLDLDILGQNWQGNVAGPSGGDFNADGFVDLLDLDILGQNWGEGTAAFAAALNAKPSTTLIPEPGSVGLMVAGTVLILRRRRSSNAV